MFEHFYNEIFRSVIISFGSLFNGIEVHKKDADNDTFSIIKVPLSYGPTQKFLARMEQQADLNKPVQKEPPIQILDDINQINNLSQHGLGSWLVPCSHILNQSP